MKILKYSTISIQVFIMVAFMLSVVYTADAIQEYRWSSQSSFLGAHRIDGVQVNILKSNTCDAERVTFIGYEYPGLNVNAPGTCTRCSGTGLSGIGSTSFVPNGQDPFAECAGVTCSGYYSKSGTQSPLATEYCYNKANIPSSAHFCDGAGACQTAGSLCVSSSNNEQQYTCGTCRYIASGACSGTTLGSCTNYASGYNTGTGLCAECDGSGSMRMAADDSSCGTIQCNGKNYYYMTGTQGATSTSYCYLRSYDSITSNRCKSLGECKSSNGDDCTSYSNSLSATAGTCRYIGGCTGTNLPTVHNYPAGTSCGTSKECDGSGTCVNICIPQTCSSLGYNCGTHSDGCGGTINCGSVPSVCATCSSGVLTMPADDSSCGTIQCSGNNHYYLTGTQASTSTSYCYLRSYNSITSNRCKSLGECKVPNSGDCTSYANTLTATAGTCRYISGCSGSTPGVVMNYNLGESCGTGRSCDGTTNCVNSECRYDTNNKWYFNRKSWRISGVSYSENVTQITWNGAMIYSDGTPYKPTASDYISYSPGYLGVSHVISGYRYFPGDFQVCYADLVNRGDAGVNNCYYQVCRIVS